MAGDDSTTVDNLCEQIHALAPQERSELLESVQADRFTDYLAVRGAYFDAITELVARAFDDGPWAEYCQNHPEDPLCQQLVSQTAAQEIQERYTEANEKYTETLREQELLDIERAVFGSDDVAPAGGSGSARTKDKFRDDGKTKTMDDIGGKPKQIHDKFPADQKPKFLDDPKSKPSDDEGPKPKFLDNPSPNPPPTPPTPPSPPPNPAPDDPEEREEPSLNARSRPFILQTPHHSSAVAHGAESASLNEQYQRLLTAYHALLEAYQQ